MICALIGKENIPSKGHYGPSEESTPQRIVEETLVPLNPRTRRMPETTAVPPESESGVFFDARERSCSVVSSDFQA